MPFAAKGADGPEGSRHFRLSLRAFHGNEMAFDFDERNAEFGEDLKVRDRSRRYIVKPFPEFLLLAGFFCPGVDDVDRFFVHIIIRNTEFVCRALLVGRKAKLFCNVFDDLQLLLGTVEERDVEVRPGDLERQSREAGAGADVEQGRAFRQVHLAQDDEAVDEMFHDDLVRLGDGREVDLLVPGDEQFCVLVKTVQGSVVEVHTVCRSGGF